MPAAGSFLLGGQTETIRTAAGADAPVLARVPSPTFLAAGPTRWYAVSEVGDGQVLAFARDAGVLADEPTSRTSSGGSFPCHLLRHPDGCWLYVANYGDGVVTAVALDDQGDLTGQVLTASHTGTGPHGDRQEGPHAHSTMLSPDGGWLIAADLGTDELRSHRLTDGRPAPEAVLSSVPPGSGPRHLMVRDGLLLVTGELSNELLAMTWDAETGVASMVERIPLLPTGAPASTASHLAQVGDAVLVGERGADVIVVLRRGSDGTGATGLAVVDRVATVPDPRHFAVVGQELVVASGSRPQVAVHPLRESGGVLVVGTARLDEHAEAPMMVLPTGP